MYDESPINIPSLSGLCASVPCLMPPLGIVIFLRVLTCCRMGYIHLPENAASLFAANDALRNSFAAGTVLFGRPLYLNWGLGRVIPARRVEYPSGGRILVLFIYGDKLRKKSKFTVYT